MKDQQFRSKNECLAAINAHTFLANHALMLREQAEYVMEVQNLALACVEVLNHHNMPLLQLISVIEGKIAATYGQHLQAVLAQIHSLQMQRRELDKQAVAYGALDRQIDSLTAYKNTSIAEMQRGIITDTFVRAANIPADLIYGYEPPTPEQSWVNGPS